MHDKYFIKDVSEEPANIRNTLSDGFQSFTKNLKA